MPSAKPSDGLTRPEKTFQRLDAPELLADVANGVVYVDGMRQRAVAEAAA